MLKSPALFIGLRYMRAKRRNHFISFISVISMVGIALGITVLITVLSVMNGFDSEIKKRVFSMVPPITITSQTGALSDWKVLQKTVTQFAPITASAPFVNGEVMLNYSGSTQAALMVGVLPEQQKTITDVANKMVQGQFSNLQPGQFGIVLGQTLAKSIDANLGDKITLITTHMGASSTVVVPRFRRFTVVGIFNAGNGFGFDKSVGFIHLQDAQTIFGFGDNVSGLYLKTNNVFAAPAIAHDLALQLSDTANVSSWADTFGGFFRAVEMNKSMLFLILLLIIAVAAFNLVATLMMVVREKEGDIAILRTYGATPRMIMAIFLVQGACIGLLGTLAGLVGGILLALNVTNIVDFIQQVFHVQLLATNVYLVNYLPSKIMLSDVMKISLASLSLSLVATVYPAWRASKMDPVEALRFE
jgi:lipoprotein-releasing system permease protein